MQKIEIRWIDMRIASLLPSSTEICYALGFGDELVAVSHECDYPPDAQSKPKLTRARVDSGLSSREIDRQVSSALHETGSLYDLDFDLLARLQPDLILTQQLCDVCAVSYEYVKDAVRGLRFSPQVVNLEPTRVADIFENIRTVGRLAGRTAQAEKFIASLEKRVERVRKMTGDLPTRPRTFLMEWIDPPYCGGHWNGELVEMAGGIDRLARIGEPSARLPWKEVAEFAPEVVVISCCGFSLDRALRETPRLDLVPEWRELPAVQEHRVFVADGNQFFSRPGPRIVESLEMLAVMIHPELAGQIEMPPGSFVPLLES